MRSFSFIAVAAALASQAMALTVQLGGALGNQSAPALFNFGSNDAFVSQAGCSDQCKNATTTLQNCNGNDQCTCQDSVGTVLLSCEQCLFNDIVNKNIPYPDEQLIGRQPVLDAFVAACLAKPLNIVLKPLKMTVPPSWEGPESNKLGVAATVITVGVGALLGGSGIWLFTQLE